MTAMAEDVRVDWDQAFQDAVAGWQQRTGAVYTAAPSSLSPIPDGTDIHEAVLGSQLLGMELTPQGCQVAAVLSAVDGYGRPLYDDVTVEIPRRATKTTSVQATLLGRCASRPGYKVIQTAQDGTRASAVFMDMVRTLEHAQPVPELRDWVVFKSTGREYLEWHNGSRWWVVSPAGRAFRGLAADVLFFDENGELDLETGQDLEAGALPVMDTRDDAQLIRAGTPGRLRQGMFWDAIQAAVRDPQELGVVVFAAKDAEVVDLAGDDGEDLAMALLWKYHPGLACGLTTERKMRQRFRKMDLATFIREYLCVWPPDSTTAALDAAKWGQTGGTPVDLPQDVPVGFGYNVGIGGVAACVAAAWYDDAGKLHGQVMEYRVGNSWLVEDLCKLLKWRPGVPLGYDPIGENLAIAQELGRKPRVNTKGVRPLNLRQVAAATATIAMAVDSLDVWHGTSRSLDQAVEETTWRESNGSRLFRRKGGADISALLAWTHAVGAIADVRRRGGGGGGYEPVAE